MRKLTVRRHVRNIATAMIVSSILGIGAGLYFHLSPFFHLGMGIVLMLGVLFYPSRRIHHHHD